MVEGRRVTGLTHVAAEAADAAPDAVVVHGITVTGGTGVEEIEAQEHLRAQGGRCLEFTRVDVGSADEILGESTYHADRYAARCQRKRRAEKALAGVATAVVVVDRKGLVANNPQVILAAAVTCRRIDTLQGAFTATAHARRALAK